MKNSKSEAWIKAIPPATGHGSGNLQKRLWRLVSDFVRIRDFYLYKGACVATGRVIGHWNMGDAGHFRPYSICRGMFKFDERNIFLQSKRSNGFGEYDDWIAFEDEVVRRTSYTKAALDKINLGYELKINDTLVKEKMRDILKKMKDLPELPEYYNRVISLSP